MHVRFRAKACHIMWYFIKMKIKEWRYDTRYSCDHPRLHDMVIWCIQLKLSDHTSCYEILHGKLI